MIEDIQSSAQRLYQGFFGKLLPLSNAYDNGAQNGDNKPHKSQNVVSDGGRTIGNIKRVVKRESSESGGDSR
jgi:hypothetical protein